MSRRLACAAAALLWLAPAPTTAFVLGGGLADADCRVGFGGVDATAGASGVVCTDGDPACDRDGSSNGSCRFDVGVCTRLDVPGCDQSELSSVAVAGLALDEPDARGSEAVCGDTAAVTVAVGMASGATLVARLRGDLKDVDYLNVCCVAASNAVAAARCATLVDVAVAGCRTKIPRRLRRSLNRARGLLTQATDAPARTVPLARKARKALVRTRKVSQRLAERDVCGNALGLVASHAQALTEALASGAVTPGRATR